MQKRLDIWRQKTANQEKKIKEDVKPTFMRQGRGDQGDVMNEAQWDEEIKRSQTRR